MSSNTSGTTTSEHTLLKGALLPTVIVGIICIGLFSLLKGLHGFYGALVAQFVVIIFFLVHLLISKLSRNLDPMATMALAMFSYFAKVMVMGAFLLILTKFTSREVIDRTSFGITALVLTAAWLGGEIKSYLSLKIHLPLPSTPIKESER
ncbi:MAG: hypothetical protein ACKOPU_03840 [Candidatus Planktophila sp.]